MLTWSHSPHRPYIKSDCGEDLSGNGNFQRMRDIYTVFRSEFCPPTLQLSAYSAQFIVSRDRILANAYNKYANLRGLLHAPDEHWIHNEGAQFYYHTFTDRANPALGYVEGLLADWVAGSEREREGR